LNLFLHSKCLIYPFSVMYMKINFKYISYA
jgi:hypothetical protein